MVLKPEAMRLIESHAMAGEGFFVQANKGYTEIRLDGYNIELFSNYKWSWENKEVFNKEYEQLTQKLENMGYILEHYNKNIIHISEL